MATKSGGVSSTVSSSFSALNSSVSSGNSSRENVDRPVSDASQNPFQTLSGCDRSGRTSPRLVGRVDREEKMEDDVGLDNQVEEMELDTELDQITSNIWNNVLSNDLRKWLTGEGWDAGDLAELESVAGSVLFVTTLCEQAATNQNKKVMNLIPRNCIQLLQEDLQQTEGDYRALFSLIPLNGAEPDQAPANIGRVPLLTPQDREANRQAYFPQGVLNFDANLRAWLAADGWDVEYLDMLETYQGEALTLEIVNLALEMERYNVIQSLPRVCSPVVLTQVEHALELHQHKVEFVNECLILD